MLKFRVSGNNSSFFLMKEDPLLQDLPPAVTLEEVNSQIALEYGQAMTVFVRREDDVVLRKLRTALQIILYWKKLLMIKSPPPLPPYFFTYFS